jgi:hypothetical protein
VQRWGTPGAPLPGLPASRHSRLTATLQRAALLSIVCLTDGVPHPLPSSFDRIDAEVAALRALSQAEVAAFYRVGGLAAAGCMGRRR